MARHTQLFVGGTWAAPVDGTTIDVVSPHTGELLAAAPAAGPADVDRAVEAARRAFDHGPWPTMDPADRIAVVRRLAEASRARRREMAETITSEMGSPISFSRFSQATLPAMLMGSFADLAEDIDWEATRTGFFGPDVVVRHEPVGVVAAIVPWNMPQFLLVGKLVPALLAGCTVVAKPAPETPFDALLLAELIAELDLPPGVVSILPGGADTGQHLVRHPGVDKVAFTGSTAAGRQVAAACGAALKRTGLELGGKSAAIVLDDADAQSVAEGLMVAGLMNGGQACVAQTRVLVPHSRLREVVEALTCAMEGLAVGDPMDPATDIGPLVTQRQRQRVRDFIDAGRAQGARLVVGGTEAPEGFGRGWYVRPTLFDQVTNAMVIAREEIFGPVLSVIAYKDDAEAVRLANDCEYGLSGSVWTNDPERALAVARQVRTGTFGVNQPYSMDPVAPFGGVKASGLGRELGPEGIDAYLDTKSISFAPAVGPQ